MATDNAKERLFSKLGLNKHALGIVTMMTSLSIPIRTSILLINNPVIQDLYSKALNKKDKFDPGIEKLVSDKIDEIIFQNREFNLKGVDQIAFKQISSSLKVAISVTGGVSVPGSYKLKSKMRLSGVIKNANGLSNDAYTEKAYLVRTELKNGKKEFITFLGIAS